jgi:hypothetical protein
VLQRRFWIAGDRFSFAANIRGRETCRKRLDAGARQTHGDGDDLRAAAVQVAGPLPHSSNLIPHDHADGGSG